MHVNDKLEADIFMGMNCLLSQEGNKGEGVVQRNESDISQFVPVPTIEVSSLYYISFLFYGNLDFSRTVALIGVPAKTQGEFGTLVFNSPSDVRKAYASYRKWFKRVKRLGLAKARRQELDPLANSGVRWY